MGSKKSSEISKDSKFTLSNYSFWVGTFNSFKYICDVWDIIFQRYKKKQKQLDAENLVEP